MSTHLGKLIERKHNVCAEGCMAVVYPLAGHKIVFLQRELQQDTNWIKMFQSRADNHKTIIFVLECIFLSSPELH
jgi:hypothetical protein